MIGKPFWALFFHSPQIALQEVVTCSSLRWEQLDSFSKFFQSRYFSLVSIIINCCSIIKEIRIWLFYTCPDQTSLLSIIFLFLSIINIHVPWSPTCLEGDLSPAPAPLLSQKSPRGKGSPGQTIIFFLLQTGRPRFRHGDDCQIIRTADALIFVTI